MYAPVRESITLPNGEATRYKEYTYYNDDPFMSCPHTWESAEEGHDKCTVCGCGRLFTSTWIEGSTRVAKVPDMAVIQDLKDLTEGQLEGKALITSMGMEIPPDPPDFPTVTQEKWPVKVEWKTIG